MAPLAVDAAALDSAGTEVVTAGEGLGSVISTLIAALSGCSGMAGDDPTGASFGHSYEAHNYSLAEAQSNISGHGDPLPTPVGLVRISRRWAAISPYTAQRCRSQRPRASRHRLFDGRLTTRLQEQVNDRFLRRFEQVPPSVTPDCRIVVSLASG
jgi:hypothetical protein